MPEHHGASRPAAQLVPNAMDFQPLVGQAFVDGHGFADAVDEDFAAAARQAAHAGFLEPAQHLAQRHLVDLVKVPELRRTEGMQVHLRKACFEIPQQLLVPLQLKAGVQSTLHEDLIAAQLNGFFDLFVQNLARQHIGVDIVALAIESAEIAHGRTDVRVVDVSVDVICAIRLGVEAPADGIGRPPQLGERGRGAVGERGCVSAPTE